MSEARRTNAELDKDLKTLQAALILLLNDLAPRGLITPQAQGTLNRILNGEGEDADATGPVRVQAG